MMSEVSLQQDGSGSESPTAEDLEELMRDKAQEIFRLCDQEMKGFITKQDMQRLQNELPLSPEELDIVFDKLDVDGSGRMTPDKFTFGFG